MQRLKLALRSKGKGVKDGIRICMARYVSKKKEGGRMPLILIDVCDLKCGKRGPVKVCKEL